jgi:hypothetical protein
LIPRTVGEDGTVNNSTEYRVWVETGELLGSFDLRSDAEFLVDAERRGCPCGRDTDPMDGLCGVEHAHGIFMQVVGDSE